MRHAVVTGIIVIILSLQAVPVAAWEEFEFEGLFQDVLDNLITNYSLDDGDWWKDMMGDDIAFAPSVLLGLGRDTGNQEYIDMGMATVEFEVQQIQRLLAGEWELFGRMVIGGPALMEGYEQTGERRYARLINVEVYAGSLLALIAPEVFGEVLLDPAAGLASVIQCDFDYFRIGAGRPDANNAKGLGLQVLDRTNELYWSESEGCYNPPIWDWGNGSMLMALAGAYKLTGEASYFERADTLLGTMDEKLFDPIRGGYFAKETSDKKGLSNNCVSTRAMIELYDATADTSYLDRAVDLIQFIEMDLCDEDPLFEGYEICFHDWTQEGHASDWCTGCNFFLLDNIYRLNKLIDEGPTVVPGLCGTLIHPNQGSSLPPLVSLLILFFPVLFIIFLKQNKRNFLIKKP